MLQFGLIGCGRIAQKHADLLGNRKILGAELGCVCDIDSNKAKQLGEKYGVPWYTHFGEMISQKNPDILSVLTPSGMHADHVIALAKFKRPIVLEKPMALSLSSADAMIAECNKYETPLFVVKQNRFNPAIQRARNAIEDGRLGRLNLVSIRVWWCRTQEYYNQDAWRGTWRWDGGILSNQASHHLDLFQWLVGPVESVFVQTKRARFQIETEDTAVALLRFKNGALGVLEGTTAACPRDLETSLSLLGDKGSIEIGGLALNETVLSTLDETSNPYQDKEGKGSRPENVYGTGHKAYLEHVVDCVVNKRSPWIGALEGKKTVELMNALYASTEQRKEIFLDDFPRSVKLGRHGEEGA